MPGTPTPRTCSAPSTPSSGSPAADDPVQLLADVLGRAAGDAVARTSSSSRTCAWSRPTSPTTSAATSGTRATRPRTRTRPRASATSRPEFGITEVLPQYSGGLGILAGDHLKTASDLGVPIIGVGLLYRQGYFRQSLNAAGWQQERYPLLDPNALPLTLLHDADGPGPDRGAARRRPHAARAGLAGPGRPRAAAAAGLRRRAQRRPRARDHRPAVRRRHRAPAGPGGAAGHRRRPRHPRLLPDHRHPGARGLPHQRGPRGLPRAGADPRVHDAGLDFDTALETRRAGTVFTTHTPVPAGIDRFPVDLVADQFAELRRCRSTGSWRSASEDYDGGDPGVFNMAVMGFRLGQRANGVSLLHGEVSPRHVPGAVARLRHHRGADHLDHQRRAPPHLGAPRPARRCSRRRRAAPARR